jgi:exonuclease-1
MPVPSSAPQPPRRTMSAQIHSGRSPPKRQRLCSESILATSSNGARVREDSTSRFFAPSPSLRKASSKTDEFELWSDESAHDAVAALADTPAHSPSPKKRKRLSVFSDASPADLRRRDSSASQKLTQDTVSSFASSISRESQAIDTPATSFGSVGDSPHIFSKGLNARFDGLKSKWAYSPETTSVEPQQQLPVQNDVSSKYVSPKEEQLDSFLLAEKLAKPEAIVPASSPILHNSPEREDDNGDEAEQVLSDKDWLDLEQQPATADLKSQIEVQGSEDMLVPESPRSNSCDGEKRSSLDLGRFAFTG